MQNLKDSKGVHGILNRTPVDITVEIYLSFSFTHSFTHYHPPRVCMGPKDGSPFTCEVCGILLVVV